jgi:hypothetical protein
MLASAAFERGRDPTREAIFLREADRLQYESRGAREDFVRLDREMAQVRAEGAALEAKRREARASLQAETLRIKGEEAKLARNEQELQLAQRKLTTHVSGTSSRIRVLATRLSSLTTYEEFPLETEKQRILDSLR